MHWSKEGMGWTARWEISTNKLRIGTSYFTPEEAKQLAEWILKGPAKPRYVITTVFDKYPDNLNLDSDGYEVKEIWE
jgi:hypothetical protein